jgi:hypothetical protein
MLIFVHCLKYIRFSDFSLHPKGNFRNVKYGMIVSRSLTLPRLALFRYSALAQALATTLDT